MLKVKQFRYYADPDRKDYNDWPKSLHDNLFQSLNGDVIKLGIQAPPGTYFHLNCYENKGNEIVVGASGIYELDVDGFAVLKSLIMSPESLKPG
jgi:hypothetical protein